jgi:hypothetical protein
MPLIFADEFWSTLAHPSDGFVVLVSVLAFVLFLLVCVVGGIIAHLRKTEIETSLKHEMIERGMSVEEIERVLAARINGSGKGECDWTDPVPKSVPDSPRADL